MKTLGNILHQYLYDRPEKRRKMRRAEIWHSWPEIVGKEMANNTEPSGSQGGMLFIRVKDGIWADQLKWIKPEIIKRIQKITQEDFPKDIRFVVGEIKSKPIPEKEKTKEIVNVNNFPTEVINRFKEKIDEETDFIENDDLKKIIRSASLNRTLSKVRKSKKH